ncbi:coniferyl aldehyde dehydrogenase [Denitratisoma sp. DHT3]|uniref:coniferyl aldehyde dehydrogenase n=1 Tax=Denitratisoma sp. DHT3 TaxID=1981880 RepID=UPI0011985E6A|nr:coniferyl aldehyde dehydrogenase [Denitratisoma sp. DHT3]QDX82454.1 coniferyl aldehyde dehydrogenase [Denitratisoma sp. DHT3]
MTPDQMRQTLDRQKADFLAAGLPDAKTRLDRLDRLAALLRENQQALLDSLCADFGHRSMEHARLTEIAVPIAEVRATHKHIGAWMKDEKRSLPWLQTLLGGRAWIQYQPLGSVGVIVPWNFPIYLAMGPLIGALAAGNRAMVKPSEFTPRVADQFATLFPRYFDEREIAVATGGAEVSAAFAELPFDHLVFTGAGAIAKHVMAAAAKNLVPLTLELGGKSPVIISREADLADAAVKIMDFKLSNAGQTCINADYLLVPEERLEAMIQALQQAAAKLFPTLLANPDYTSVVNKRHFDRLDRYVDDALAAGVQCVEINPAGESFAVQPEGQHKMMPRLFINPDDERLIMREEIFGPLLPIKTYRQMDEAIDYINRHDRPLALYYFGPASGPEVERVLKRTISGGVAINDIGAHAACENLPFGGVGPSGMGAYHGRDGFRQFSHAKSIYRQTRVDLSSVFGMRAPYGDKFRAGVARFMK